MWDAECQKRLRKLRAGKQGPDDLRSSIPILIGYLAAAAGLVWVLHDIEPNGCGAICLTSTGGGSGWRSCAMRSVTSARDGAGVCWYGLREIFDARRNAGDLCRVVHQRSPADAPRRTGARVSGRALGGCCISGGDPFDVSGTHFRGLWMAAGVGLTAVCVHSPVDWRRRANFLGWRWSPWQCFLH